MIDTAEYALELWLRWGVFLAIVAFSSFVLLRYVEGVVSLPYLSWFFRGKPGRGFQKSSLGNSPTSGGCTPAGHDALASYFKRELHPIGNVNLSYRASYAKGEALPWVWLAKTVLSFTVTLFACKNRVVFFSCLQFNSLGPVGKGKISNLGRFKCFHSRHASVSTLEFTGELKRRERGKRFSPLSPSALPDRPSLSRISTRMLWHPPGQHLRFTKTASLKSGILYQ